MMGNKIIYIADPAIKERLDRAGIEPQRTLTDVGGHTYWMYEAEDDTPFLFAAHGDANIYVQTRIREDFICR